VGSIFITSPKIAVNIDPIKSHQPTGVESVSRRGVSTGGNKNAPSTGDAVLDNISQQNLVDQVRDMPEIRTDVTSIGRKLAEDPNYPPDEVIDKLANLLADLGPGWMDDLDTEEELPGTEA